MEPLLSTLELSEIRDIGVSMMVTEMVIVRQRVVLVGDTGYDPVYPYGDDLSSYDYGDDAYFEDEVTQPDQIEEITGSETIVKGWFVPVLAADVAADIDLSTITRNIIRFPVGTDIREKDLIRVVSNAAEYLVIDVGDDATWPEWLKVTVRRAV